MKLKHLLGWIVVCLVFLDRDWRSRYEYLKESSTEIYEALKAEILTKDVTIQFLRQELEKQKEVPKP